MKYFRSEISDTSSKENKNKKFFVSSPLMIRYPECEKRHPGFDSHSLMYMFTFNLCCLKLNIYIKFHLTQ